MLGPLWSGHDILKVFSHAVCPGCEFMWTLDSVSPFCTFSIFPGAQQVTGKGGGDEMGGSPAMGGLNRADPVGGLWLSEPGSFSWESQAKGEGWGGVALLTSVETLRPEPPPLARQNGYGEG